MPIRSCARPGTKGKHNELHRPYLHQPCFVTKILRCPSGLVHIQVLRVNTMSYTGLDLHQPCFVTKILRCPSGLVHIQVLRVNTMSYTGRDLHQPCSVTKILRCPSGLVHIQVLRVNTMSYTGLDLHQPWSVTKMLRCPTGLVYTQIQRVNTLIYISIVSRKGSVLITRHCIPRDFSSFNRSLRQPQSLTPSCLHGPLTTSIHLTITIQRKYID